MTIDRVRFYVHVSPLIRFEEFGACTYKPYLLIQSQDMPGYVNIGYIDVDLRRPTLEEFTVKAVEVLRGVQAHIRAKAEIEATEIEGQIQSILAIGES